MACCRRLLAAAKAAAASAASLLSPCPQLPALARAHCASSPRPQARLLCCAVPAKPAASESTSEQEGARSISSVPSEARVSYDDVDQEFVRYTKNAVKFVCKAKMVGKKEGDFGARISVAWNLLDAGYPIKQIEQITSLPSEVILGSSSK